MDNKKTKFVGQIAILVAVIAAVSLIIGAVTIQTIPPIEHPLQRVISIGLAAFAGTVIAFLLVIFFFGPVVTPDLLVRLADVFREKSQRYLATPELKVELPAAVPEYDLNLFDRFKWLTANSSPAADKTSNSRIKEGIESLRNLSPDGSELWVVASGKGGVGKSLISLGLLEDLSRNGPVLLLDFDLHNCGLTSLLKLKESNTTDSAYSLIDQFRMMLGVDGASGPIREVLDNQYQLPNFEAKDYNNILWKFQSDCRLTPNIWSNLADAKRLRPKLKRLAPDKTDWMVVPGEPSALNPENAFIMPSRLADQRLLLMPVSFLSYVAVFLFLRAMCFWLSKNVHTIILDCHGAHEAFTVASVLAAEKLIVVTTTDPGSFDGTVELLDAVNRRTKLGLGVPEDTVIVFNNCPPNGGQQIEEKIKEEMRRLESQGLFHSRGTVCIPDDPRIREMIKSYEFGHISQHRQLWMKIREITKLLKRAGERKHTGSFPRPSVLGTEKTTQIIPRPNLKDGGGDVKR